MLHANLGPPRPPPRNFQKNLNPSCSRSRGGMRAWPVHRPTHAPAIALKTNGNSAPIKPVSFPSSGHVKKSPKQNPLVPPLLRRHVARKTNPLVPSSPEAARRRMTTPVVNTRPTPEQPPKKKNRRHSGIFRAAPPPSWNDAARKISGISRASGLPRPHFRNADTVRHAPCQSRAATTSPSQLSKKPKPLVLPLLRRHACLAGPPANTCSRNRPQNKRQQRPAQP